MQGESGCGQVDGTGLIAHQSVTHSLKLPVQLWEANLNGTENTPAIVGDKWNQDCLVSTPPSTLCQHSTLPIPRHLGQWLTWLAAYWTLSPSPLER